jgi:hypothetical protein
MSDIWGKQAAAYEKLHLTPLDEFLQIQLEARRQSFHLIQKEAGHPDDGIPGRQSEHLLYRQIGGTTWMCVRAALAAMEGQPVILSGRDKGEANRIGFLTLSFYQRLGGEILRSSLDSATVAGGSLIKWSSKQTLPMIPSDTLLFEDKAWTYRAIRRAKGPFHMITDIRQESDHQGFIVYNAYAEDDELIMQVPFETAQSISGKFSVGGR